MTDPAIADIARDIAVPPPAPSSRTELTTGVLPVASIFGAGAPDPDAFSRHFFDHPLHENQKEVVAALTSRDRVVQVIEPRQAGKTASVAVAESINCEIEGGAWNRTHSEPYRIGIFAPKLAQAQIDIERIKSWARATANGRRLLDWEQTTNSRVVWHNGAEILAITANENAQNEGKTLNRIVVEEAQKVSDHVMSEVVLPMGTATGASIAKVGTVRPIQNHFYRTWHEDPRATKVWHHWLACGNYLREGYRAFVGRDGVERSISRYILDMMPLAVKQVYVEAGVFPNDPEWLFHGQVEYGDFLTQYELKWLEQYGLFLTADEKAALFNGAARIMSAQASLLDELYAGIDFATGVEQDETAVSVWLRVGMMKVKVWGCTWADLSLPEQKRELANIFGRGGRFHGVKLILGDVGGNGLALIQDLSAEANIPIQPVNFGATDKDLRGVSMNMKTSMFMDFKRDCQMGRISYGQVDASAPVEVAMQWAKGVRQWSALEQEIMASGINRRIQAPDSDHDDVPCADVLALRAAKMGPQLFGMAGPKKLGVMPHFIVRSDVYR